MKIIAEKYRALKPDITYLTDSVVMAQAWKKTHAYIRSFNWYADTLALDVSALSIEHDADKWALQLKSGGALRKLELVPAAKSESWIIDKDKGWIPKLDESVREEKPPIRPLAHITIRDQTWATTAMMCLADAVETAQGDCSNHPLGAQRNVFSYGNRLVCDWNTNDQAWFRWGNSEIYRKFYTDYQNFLKRPITIGRKVVEQDQDAEDVYVVNLDLSKFYDNIDRNILIQRLQKISDEFGNTHNDMFWNRFAKLTAWEWSKKDYSFANDNNIKIASGKGLPQGLVSSGFFANAYMIDFDQKLGQLIGKDISSKRGIILHDYCRYVDDLRLVISSENESPRQLRRRIHRWIKTLLQEHAGDKITLNTDKTKITAIADLDNSGSMANRIDILQGELSGPADRDILDSASGMLEGLLTIENEEIPELSSNHNDIPLVQLAKFDHDIRPDTLKRFAANRLESIMRSKRSITPMDDDISSSFSTKQIENESELLAKKLIYAWMKDPSLGLVLRKAIEIYPCAELFEPVFESIYIRSSCNNKNESKTTAFMMDFLLADLFRCCCDFNGYSQSVSYPSSVVPSSILELASRYAQKTLVLDNLKPFIKRQVLLLLAIANKPVASISGAQSEQATLHSILNGTPPEDIREWWVLFEISGQMTNNNNTYASLLLESANKLDGNIEIVELFAKRGGPFWESLWKKINKTKQYKSDYRSLKWAAPITSTVPQNISQRLSKIIASDTNGFEYEAALIKLGLGLLALVGREQAAITTAPNDIKIAFPEGGSWSRIWHPDIKSIECVIDKRYKFIDPRFTLPDWVKSSGEDPSLAAQKVYWIGSILRAAAVGGSDFTSSRWKENNINTYKGIRTSWHKRRMGMMHSPEALVGEYSTVTDWFSELLMRCLQWPGFESTFVKHDDIRSIVDLISFKSALQGRLNKLNSLYCRSSDMPALCSEVKRPKTIAGNSDFRIVTVQQLLPKTTDFSITDPTLSHSKIKADHREHY